MSLPMLPFSAGGDIIGAPLAVAQDMADLAVAIVIASQSAPALLVPGILAICCDKVAFAMLCESPLSAGGLGPLSLGLGAILGMGGLIDKMPEATG